MCFAIGAGEKSVPAPNLDVSGLSFLSHPRGAEDYMDGGTAVGSILGNSPPKKDNNPSVTLIRKQILCLSEDIIEALFGAHKGILTRPEST